MPNKLTPDFEVKCLLKPGEVLTADGKLKGDVVSAFGITADPKKMTIQFMDTENKDISTNGWNLRIRKTEGKDKIELTYKKRYPLDSSAETGISEVQHNITTAVAKAEHDGFDVASDFDAQIEVGYQKQTLSISRDKKVSGDGLEGLNLPLANEARDFLIEEAPRQFRKWSSGMDHLREAVVYGPVHATRSEGTLGDLEIDIEVWPIRKSKSDSALELTVEASFKAKTIENALKGKADLVKLLSDRGWLLPEDSLKTQLIMERYG